MHRLDLVPAIVDAGGGTATGRTAVQKIGYFASLKAGLEGIRCKDCFYGPFSREVAVGTEDARAALLVNEAVRSSPIESYTCALADDGREIVGHARGECPEECSAIDRIVAVCRERCGLSAHPLACAAKSHCALARAGVEAGRTPAGIERLAGGFGRNLKEDDIRRGAALLGALSLPPDPAPGRSAQASP